jgi:NADH:ubiquinone oxidoreductase subunit 5 (subunit L)/multisubunit Na+/H+ antiporter MnhA subunit
LTHALFKALLFICAGGVFHSMGDSQDFRFMSGLSIYIPFTSLSLMIYNLSLSLSFITRALIKINTVTKFSLRVQSMFYYCKQQI